MNKTITVLCIIISVFALLFCVTGCVNEKQGETNVTVGQTGGDCDNISALSEVQTTHGCNKDHSADTTLTAATEQAFMQEEAEVKTISDFLKNVKLDGMSNYSFRKSEGQQRRFFEGVRTASFILDTLYSFGECIITDLKPDNEYGYHFTFYSGDEKYEFSVLDKYVRFSTAEKIWCFLTGANFYTCFSPTYLRRFQCLPPVDENVPEEIIRFNPETVHLECSDSISDAVGHSSKYTLGQEVLLKKNGEVQKTYAVNDSIKDIIENCFNIVDENYDNIEKGKSEICFTLYNFGQSYNVSFNSNGYTYISQGDFEKRFETVGAYYLFKMQMLKNSVADNEETTQPIEPETETFLPPGFDLKRILTESETLGEFWSDAMYYHIQSSQWVTYEQSGKQDVIYSIGFDGHELADGLIESNFDKKAEDRVSTTGEAIVFESSFNGETGIISTRLCNDGYLYITFGEVTRGFNIGVDAYNKFMKDFECCSCIWTSDNPVTIG